MGFWRRFLCFWCEKKVKTSKIFRKERNKRKNTCKRSVEQSGSKRMNERRQNKKRDIHWTLLQCNWCWCSIIELLHYPANRRNTNEWYRREKSACMCVSVCVCLCDRIECNRGIENWCRRTTRYLQICEWLLGTNAYGCLHNFIHSTHSFK